MFTNEQIRTAMQGLVDKKGENHASYGRYGDPVTGEGTCFLGALAEYMGFAVPGEGTPARSVLGISAVSPEMGDAFYVAQCLNDAHFEWKYVLLGVDLALDPKRLSKPVNGCPCGCGVSKDFTDVLDAVKRRRALDGVGMPRDFGGFVSGGFISTTGIKIKDVSFTNAIGSMGSITFNMTATAGSFAQLEKALSVPAQKDHALVA
jgi:hypothetical protein